MKVLHIFNEIKFSGAEIMYANAAELFSKNGIVISALATGENTGAYEEQFAKANIAIEHKVLLESENPFKLFFYLLWLRKYIKKEGYDLVHIHRSTFKWIHAFAAFLAGKPVIYTAHNVFRNRKITWFKAYLERRSARKMFGLVTQSIGESVYLNELEYYKNPSVKVNNWYDSKRFFPPLDDMEKTKKREALGLRKEQFVIISTGGCSLIKNHHDILSALNKLKEKLDFVYLHLGHGKTEEDEKKIAEHFGIADRVKFLGNHSDVRSFLIASDVFVMPSKFEGLGNAAIEAMACNVPVILYDVVGLKDLIKNDDNGFLIPCNDGALADTLLFSYQNQQVVQEKANRALEFVKTDFSIESSVASIISLYRKQL